MYDFFVILQTQKMADFNIINAESNSNIQRSQPQMRALARDVKDYSSLIEPLKQLQSHSSKILKQYHEFLKENNKKTMGLPYNMLKKFQQLKKALAQVSLLLRTQGRFFSTQVENRQFQKANEQHFFKKTLLSYDQKRLWLKDYILKNETKMQGVQEEVKKNIEYETHRYTQYLSTIDIQRLQHSYSSKLDQSRRVINQLVRNVQVRARLKKKLEECKNHNNIIPENNKKVEDSKETSNIKAGTYSLMSFLFHQLTKSAILNDFAMQNLKKLRNTKIQMSSNNMKLKIAIDLLNQSIEQRERQDNMTTTVSIHFQNDIQEKKVSRTDFLIYLKELHRDAFLIMKQHGLYFQYVLNNKTSFPYSGKSKSVNKVRQIPQQSQMSKFYEKEQMLLSLHQINQISKSNHRKINGKYIYEENVIQIQEYQANISANSKEEQEEYEEEQKQKDEKENIKQKMELDNKQQRKHKDEMIQ